MNLINYKTKFNERLKSERGIIVDSNKIKCTNSYSPAKIPCQQNDCEEYIEISMAKRFFEKNIYGKWSLLDTCLKCRKDSFKLNFLACLKNDRHVVLDPKDLEYTRSDQQIKIPCQGQNCNEIIKISQAKNLITKTKNDTWAASILCKFCRNDKFIESHKKLFELRQNKHEYEIYWYSYHKKPDRNDRYITLKHNCGKIYDICARTFFINKTDCWDCYGAAQSQHNKYKFSKAKEEYEGKVNAKWAWLYGPIIITSDYMGKEKPINYICPNCKEQKSHRAKALFSNDGSIPCICYANFRLRKNELRCNIILNHFSKIVNGKIVHDKSLKKISEMLQIKNVNNIHNLRPDFILQIPNYKQLIMIEYHGIQHYAPTKFIKNITDKKSIDQLEKTKKNDALKAKFAADNNIKLIIIDGRKNYGFENLKKYLINRLSKSSVLKELALKASNILESMKDLQDIG